MTEDGDKHARAIARMVLEDMSTTGRLRPETANILLMTIERQPGEPPVMRFGGTAAVEAAAEPPPGPTPSSEALARFARFTADMRGRIVRHPGRGGTYRVLGGGKLQTRETLGDMAGLVFYQGEDGSLWARPLHEMWDGRFTFEPDGAEPPVPVPGLGFRP